ncbi:MAG TPA: peptidoglycan-binding domain-containing protein, partial [Pyrinomonadaceae bacterium]
GEVLKQGSRGRAVSILQNRLNHHGAKLAVDGDFGKKTHQAVLLFQKSRGLKDDGIVGKITWAALFKN